MKTGVSSLVLNSYEQAILKGFHGEVTVIEDEKRTAKLVNRFLDTKIKSVMEDGSEAEFSVEELLVATNIAQAIKKPKGLETIMELQKIRGEAKDIQEVNVSLVDARLKGMGFKKLDE
ncbi:MAG: hypothetical protein WCY90_00180 [Bacilli bacterium]